jgi:hypothetical protein
MTRKPYLTQFVKVFKFSVLFSHEEDDEKVHIDLSALSSENYYGYENTISNPKCIEMSIARIGIEIFLPWIIGMRSWRYC